MNLFEKLLYRIPQIIFIVAAILFNLFPAWFGAINHGCYWFNSPIISCAIFGGFLLFFAYYFEQKYKINRGLASVQPYKGYDIIIDGEKRKIVSHNDISATLDKPFKLDDEICEHFNPDDGIECPHPEEDYKVCQCCFGCRRLEECPDRCRECCDPGSNIGE